MSATAKPGSRRSTARAAKTPGTTPRENTKPSVTVVEANGSQRTGWRSEERTQFLIDTVGGVNKLAKTLGVSPSQPSRWKTGAETPSPEVAAKLLDLDHVIALAVQTWHPTVVMDWMTSSNGFLGGARPIDVLLQRGPAEVIDALKATLSGAYVQLLLLYRVFPYLSAAKEGEPGHPLYVHPAQGKGRWDNPNWYLAWYMASEATSAVGESFAHLSVWRTYMFEFPQIRGARRALGVYELPDDLPYVDLDDAATLVEQGMRPSQVVERNRPYTQAKALGLYQARKWNGIRWWSFHRPEWRVWCLWDIDPKCETVDHLDTGHVAVRDAAGTLVRPMHP